MGCDFVRTGFACIDIVGGDVVEVADGVYTGYGNKELVFAGMAIMALLMLGVGFIGFRRFV